MKPRILLDVDGVLADFTGHLLKSLAARGHDLYTDEHLTEWSLKACLPQSMHKDIDTLMATRGFFASIPRYDGAYRFVNRLRDIGEIVALTTCFTAFAEQERYDWLMAMGFYDHETVIVDHHDKKKYVPGNIVIDDRIETLRDWPITAKRICFDRPWNRGAYKVDARVKDYDQCIAVVKAFL